MDQRRELLPEAETRPGTTDGPATATPSPSGPDRRRPERGHYVNPWLIALQRNPLGAKEIRDALKPAKGVLIGLLLVIPFWAAVGLLGWYFLAR